MGVLPISEAGLRMFVLIDLDGNLLRCIDNLYQARSATTSGVASVLGAPRQLRGSQAHCVGKLRVSEMFQQIKDHGQQHKGSRAKAAGTKQQRNPKSYDEPYRRGAR